MRSFEISSCKARLDNLFERTNLFSQEPEILSYWAQYLCVLVSGFIENSVRIVLTEYTKVRSAPFVANYTERELSHFQNAKIEKILDLVGSFSPDWRDAIERETAGEIKDAVDSIVANKNLIVHGESVGLTYSRVVNYYVNVVKAIEILEGHCC